MKFTRITHSPTVMGGKPCIRGLRVTVGTIVGLLAAGESRERILEAYPYLEPADLNECLAYATKGERTLHRSGRNTKGKEQASGLTPAITLELGE